MSAAPVAVAEQMPAEESGELVKSVMLEHEGEKESSTADLTKPVPSGEPNASSATVPAVQSAIDPARLYRIAEVRSLELPIPVYRLHRLILNYIRPRAVHATVTERIPGAVLLLMLEAEKKTPPRPVPIQFTEILPGEYTQ